MHRFRVTFCFFVLVFCGLTLAIFTGCEKQVAESSSQQNAAPKTGVIAGTALLSNPKDNNHEGILIYLAGTSYSARTDRDGSYRLDGVPKGTYSAVAEKAGYQTTAIDQVALDPAVNNSDHPATLKTPVLERANSELTTAPATAAKVLGSIAGNVVVMGSDSGEGVRIAINNTKFVTVSDEGGIYQIPNIEPGSYTITFSKAAFKEISVPVKVEPGRDARVTEVVMNREEPKSASPGETPSENIIHGKLSGDRTISGIVQLRDDAGNPSADFSRASVSLDNSDYVVTVNEQGQFKFVNLDPGLYTVLGVVDGGKPVAQTADVTVEKSAQVVLKIGPSTDQKSAGEGIVIGRIILPGADDAPMADASGVNVGLSGTQSVAVTDQKGQFKLEKIPTGDYSFVASKPDFESFRKDGLTVAAGQTLDLGDLTMEPKRDYPKVVSTDPANGVKNVTVGNDLTVQIKFSKNMNAKSVLGALQITPKPNAQTFMGKGQHPMADDDTLVVVFSNADERNPIKYGTVYRVAIAKSAADSTGVQMKEDYFMTFTTGAPGVIGTYPRNGDKAYVDQASSMVTISFNTKLKTETVNANNFRIRPTSGINVNVLNETDFKTGFSTVKLGTQLQDNTEYTVTVSRDVRSYNGQALGNTPYTFHFRTPKPEIQISPPTVIH